MLHPRESGVVLAEAQEQHLRVKQWIHNWHGRHCRELLERWVDRKPERIERRVRVVSLTSSQVSSPPAMVRCRRVILGGRTHSAMPRCVSCGVPSAPIPEFRYAGHTSGIGLIDAFLGMIAHYRRHSGHSTPRSLLGGEQT
jgi:hypothetical protein